ncbi:hypothetical protein MKW94_013582, partial [Papaver nudicaule]|nr:hypothetical protein [Papaver nudicaule]
MSTNNSSTVGDDHRLHETIMLSTKLIVESQEAMLHRIEACNEASNARVEASSAGIEALLYKVVECQAQNQQQMLEMLKMLANNNNSMNTNARTSNEEAPAGNGTPIDIPNGQNPTVNDEIEEVVENEPSQINQQQVIENDSSHLGRYIIIPLIEDIRALDWEKANKYLHAHKTTFEEFFTTRDSRHQIYYIIYQAGYFHQYKFLEEFLKLVPPEALEYLNEEGYTLLHKAAIFGDINFVKALVQKNPRLTQIRADCIHHQVPLLMAAISTTDTQKEVVEYLCSVTKDEDPSPFSGEDGAVLLLCLISADMYGAALSVCQRFPRLVKYLDTYKHGHGDIKLLQDISERPFAFLSGSNMKWWELIKVDTDGEKQEVLEPSKGTILGDAENPLETGSIRENCRTSNISFYFMRYIRRVPLIRRLYDQKLMHKNVVALTKYFLTQVHKKEKDKERVKEIFLKNKLLETPMKFGTTEFVLECLREFPFSNDTLT